MDRRTFLQSSVAASAIGFSSGIFKNASAAVNPAISDNLVVNCKDSRMVTGTYSADPPTQFSRLDNAQIKANLDALAMALAAKTTAAAAWATIFQKPAGKEWAAVTVSIKVNCIERSMMVKPAIIGKVCDALIALGVNATNICLFDGGNATSEATNYSPFIGSGKPIPAGVAALNKATSQGVKNSRNIMVNCSINKGHPNGNAGLVTLSMKNLTGAYQFSCPNSKDQLVGWSQDAIANGHQQLCIVDSLFAACNGPNSPASAQPNALTMSTHPAAIDTLVTNKIRKTVMGCSEDTASFDYFLNKFNMTRTALQWVEVNPGSITSVINPAKADNHHAFDIQIGGKNHILANVKLPGNHTCNVMHINGTVVATQKGSGAMTYTFCDKLAPGSYVVSIKGERGFSAERVAHLFGR
jgi:hypothetical protein